MSSIFPVFIGAGLKPRVAACGRRYLSIWSKDLPDKGCRVLPFTLWKHTPLPWIKVMNPSLLGSLCRAHLG